MESCSFSEHPAFSHSIKPFRYKMGIKFTKNSLVVEQNNYGTKIVNAYIVYYVDYWLRNSLNNVTLKNCLLCVTDIIKNSN